MAHYTNGHMSQLLFDARSILQEMKTDRMESNVQEALDKADADLMAPFKGMKWHPRFVVWELTLACNMRCGHCGSTAGVGRNDELNLDEMLRVCDDLGELECERLTLLGGEPLIHPHWEDVTRRLQNNGVRVNVITNGWTLDDPAACDRLKDAGLTIIGISIDGMKQSHDTLRREGSFDRIMKGIDLLRERGIAVAACTVITTDSIKDLDALHTRLLEKGVSVWQLQIASPLGRLTPDNPLIIKPEQIKDIYTLFDEKRRAFPEMHIDLADDIGYYPPWSEGYLRNTRNTGTIWVGCHAGIQIAGIDSNGDIKGCQSLPSIPEFIEGNVRERPLKEIWNDPDTFSYNRKFSKSTLQGYCSTCKWGVLCKGGCSSAAYSHTGSIGDNPMCYHRYLNEDQAS